jgi:TetR/AcrR family transcriptional repressor of nem operon
MSTRDNILEYAGSLIQNVGYKGFSYADLSKHIGVTKATIHHYFPTKEDLGIAYCERKIEVLSLFRESLAAMPTAPEKFTAYLESFKSCQNGRMCGINAMQSDVGDMSDVLIRKVRAVTEMELEILTEILTEGRVREEMSFVISPYEQAVIISSALKGGLLLGRVKRDESFERLCASIRLSMGIKETLE